MNNNKTFFFQDIHLKRKKKKKCNKQDTVVVSSKMQKGYNHIVVTLAGMPVSHMIGCGGGVGECLGLPSGEATSGFNLGQTLHSGQSC